MNLYNVKEFYRTHQLQDTKITPINLLVLDYIDSLVPNNIFEFGCNQGKNLSWLEEKGYWNVYGIDINNIEHPKSSWGDEKTLDTYANDICSVAFTVSVLNHLPYDVVKTIIYDLRRIADVVVLGEVEHKIDHERWFCHDYEKLGFTKINHIYQREKTYGLYTSKSEK